MFKRGDLDGLRFTAICVASGVFGLIATSTPLAEDPLVYWLRVESILSGELPYLEAAVEHLPVAVLHMVGVWLAGGFLSAEVFRVLYAVSAGVFLFGVAKVSSEISEVNGTDPVFWRVTLITAPLYPLVLFRNDPLSVLAMLLALVAWFKGSRGRAAVWTGVGIAAKGWPVVIVGAALWRRSWRWAAAVAGFAAVLIGTLSFTPGFRSGREFSGLHIESSAGALIGLGDAFSADGGSIQRQAGAFYLDAPPVATIGQVLLGGTVIAAIVWAAGRQPYAHDRLIRLLAGLVLGILLGSPLFSAQFLIWVLPLLAIDADQWIRRYASASAILTLGYLLAWQWLATFETAWFAIVVIRDAILAVLAIRLVSLLARELSSRPVRVGT